MLLLFYHIFLISISIFLQSFNMMQFFFLQFPMGPGSDGPMGGLGGMDSHHMNGSLGKDNYLEVLI